MRNRDTVKKISIIIGVLMIISMLLLTLAPLFAY
jgi:hypothetical protein